MPSAERHEGERREHQQQPEHAATLYYQAVYFPTEPLAHQAYLQARELLLARSEPCDLSVYRFLLARIPHLVVLGERPSDELDQGLRSILATGQPARVSDDLLSILVHLWDRRLAVTRHGQGFEGHDRPGRRL